MRFASHRLAIFLGALMTAATSVATAQSRATLFDRVAQVLQSSHYDTAFRSDRLPALIEEFRREAHAASDTDQRDIVWRFLGRIPSSHLGLLSPAGRARMEDELFGRPRPTLGMQIMRWRDRYYAAMVLTGGPAARAGIETWDEVIAIDGAPVGTSRRLDWRTDDAHLSDDRDPPMHALLVQGADRVRLTIATRPGERRDLTVLATPYSALEAARQSARVIDVDGKRLAYIHFWFLHMTGVPEALGDALDSVLARSQGLVLDLRGRGGSAPVVPRLLRLIEPGPERRFAGPVVALVDRQARSGKEAMAYELRTRRLARLVGEPTAGAVIPAAFADLGDAVLIYPPMTLPTYTERLELKPTPPDVAVEWGGPYSGRRDPILAAGLRELARMIAADGEGRVLPRPVVATESPVAASSLQPPPTLTALIESMTRAYGGAVALRRHVSMTARGSVRIVDTPLSGRFSLEISSSRYHSTMELGPTITIVQHSDSAGAWTTGPGAPTPQTPSGLEAIPVVWQSLLSPPVQFAAAFPAATVDGVERFDRTDCVRVRLSGSGTEAVDLLVDSRSWLPRALRFRAPSPLGPMTVITYFRSYRDVGGVMVADVVVTDVGAQQTEVTLTEIDRRS